MRNRLLTNARNAVANSTGKIADDVMVRFDEHYVEYDGDVVAHFDTQLKTIAWSAPGLLRAGIDSKRCRANYQDMVKGQMGGRGRGA